MKAILAILGLVFSTCCLAEEGNLNSSASTPDETTMPEKKERTVVQKFRGDTQYHYLKCQMTIENENLSLKYQGSVKCLSDAREVTKEKFKNAELDISKNEQVTTLLKEYYILWLTALNSLERGQSERKSDYSKRIAETKSKADEAWNRFEMENSL